GMGSSNRGATPHGSGRSKRATAAVKVSDPTAEMEIALLNDGALTVAGIDEVGRGAWAGPVSVGVTVIDRASIALIPKGVRDSKMLTPLARERLFAPLCAAVISFSVGHASSTECDG